MRICQVGTGTLQIPSGGAGGVENTVHHLSLALARMGNQVTVIDVPNPKRAYAPYERVEVGPLYPRFSNLPEQALRGLTFQLAVWRRLRSLLPERKFEVIHFHGQLGAGISLRLSHNRRLLTVFGSHNAIWGAEEFCRSWRVRARFLGEIDAFRVSGGVICDSAIMRNNLTRYLGVPSHKILNIPIGVDDETLAHQPVDDTLRAVHRPTGSRMILNVARLAPYKDQLTLVRALALVHREKPNTRLLLVGPTTDLSYKKKVIAEIQMLGLDAVVTMLGQVPRSTLLQLYELCDVFVLSSGNEAQGLSLLEAMAKGKPIIASAIAPVLEVLPPGGGMAVPPHRPHLFAQAILSVLKDPAKGCEMGKQSRAHAFKSYRWGTIAERTIRAYETFRNGGDDSEDYL